VPWPAKPSTRACRGLTLAEPVEVAVAPPFAGAALLDFLHRHMVAGVETGGVAVGAGRTVVRYARTLRLPHGPGTVGLSWDGERLLADLAVEPADRALALARVRHLVDAGADPQAVDSHLGADEHLAGLVAATPGLRVPGVLDPAEMAFRTVIGQQISLASARTSCATITRRHGQPLEGHEPGLGWLFPSPERLAAADPTTLPMPGARGRALVALAERLADGRLDLSVTGDLAATRAALLACPGIGPWTADYVLMRVAHAPDVLLTSDLVIGRELAARRVLDPGRWSPYRSYAAMHLWHDFLGRTP
jgi:AraC family transcriptional regulator of adaptative response / DNA-3-methyladenine glycosylase II